MDLFSSVHNASNMSTIFTNKGIRDKILIKLWKQCKNEEMCDIVLLVGSDEKRIPAHRNILSAATDFFEIMFSSGMRESSSKEVKLPSQNGDVLQRLVEYFYTGRVTITQDIVVELLKSAHMLLLSEVVEACEDFMAEQLNPSNCLGFLNFAEQYNCEVLLQKAKDYCLKNFMQVWKVGEFLKLNAEQIGQLMASDDLCVDTEEDVFNSLLKWLEHEQREREQHKAELLKLVRMPLLKRSFLSEHVEIICTSAECLQFYMEALEWHLSPEMNVFSEYKFTKPRGPDQILMGIEVSRPDNKMSFLYYYAQENEWMEWLKELKYRSSFGRAVLANDLYIIGGLDAKENILNTVLCINLKTMTLKKINPMKEHRAWCSAVVLNGFLYAVGGNNGKSDLNSVEKFDPKTNKWEAVASMSIQRCNIGIASLDQKLYVFGGTSNGSALSSAECYEPKTNVWQSIVSMGENRELLGVAVANGLLYAVGGYKKRTVERYDPQTNKWSTMCSLSQEMYGMRCTTLRDKVVVCFDDHIEVYNSATNQWKQIVYFRNLNIYNIFSLSDKL